MFCNFAVSVSLFTAGVEVNATWHICKMDTTNELELRFWQERIKGQSYYYGSELAFILANFSRLDAIMSQNYKHF